MSNVYYCETASDLLSAGEPKGNAECPGGEAGGGLVRARRLPGRRRASLYQPMVLRIANKAAAAVLLSVNRVG
jgi:hypothetical protein